MIIITRSPPNSFSNNLKSNIKLLMEKHNISQKDLSEILGYSDNDIDRLLDGELLIHPNDLRKMAELFGVTRHQLMNSIEENNG